MSVGPSISANGETIAFFSFASNLEPSAKDDCAGKATGQYCGALYIYDDPSKTLEHIPVGLPYPEGSGTAISANGRYVAFSAHSAALIDNGVYVFDRSTRTLDRVYQDGGYVDISGDGRFVAFAGSPNATGGQANNGPVEVFLYDRETRNTERVTPVTGTGSGERSGVHSGVDGVSISTDGRYVVFASTVPGLVNHAIPSCKTYYGEMLPTCAEIYLYDHKSRTIELISVAEDGDPGNAPSQDMCLSDDGRFVAYTSFATNLATVGPIQCVDPGYCPQVFLRDRQNDQTRFVISGLNRQPPDGYSVVSDISGDGRWVAYNSLASNLIVNGPKGGSYVSDIFTLLGMQK